MPSGDYDRPTFAKDATLVAEEFNNFFANVRMNSAKLAGQTTRKFDLPPFIRPLAPDIVIEDDNMFHLKQ